MNIVNSNQKTTNLNSKMTSKLIYDVKGKIGKVEKSFYEMSDDEIATLMKKERFSLTLPREVRIIGVWRL